jgi:hypothetical protein
MITISSYLVVAFTGVTVLMAWAYFGRFRIKRPPIGLFTLVDIVIMFIFIILIPFIYLNSPAWLTIGLLALGSLNILYFTWEAIIPHPLARWALVFAFLLADIGAAAVVKTGSNWYFAINNLVIGCCMIGLTNLWAQSGMKARHVIILALLLMIYDYIATSRLMIMSNIFTQLADLPFSPVLAWTTDGAVHSIGAGDVLMATVFSLVMRKSFGRISGIIALISMVMVFVIAPLVLSNTLFPAMVLLAPLMTIQYFYWRYTKGQERTTGQFFAETMSPI